MTKATEETLSILGGISVVSLIALASLYSVTSYMNKPKFKVGDCVTYARAEKWEHHPIEQVIEVGKKKYLLTFADLLKEFPNQNPETHEEYINFEDNYSMKTECP